MACQSFHLIVKQLSIIFFLFQPDLTPWGKDMPMFADFLNGCRFAETHLSFIE